MISSRCMKHTVSLLVLCLSLLGCNGDAADPAKPRADEKKPTEDAKGAEGSAPEANAVEFPAPVAEGRIELRGTAGALAGKQFAGAPVEAGYSKQYQQVYTQTQPFAEGEPALTYTVMSTLTQLTPGVHADVKEGFKVYGMDGGHDDTSMFSGAVRIEKADPATGTFAFVYVGTLSRDGEDTAVVGGMNVVVPVGD